MIFDTHVHYDDSAFDEDRSFILESLRANGVENVVNIGASIQSSKNTLELIKKYSWIYGAIGVHPSESSELNDTLLGWIKEVAKHERVVAIGEIGLDYYWDEPSRDIQKYWFRKQLDTARELKLPVVIHSRDAAKDTLDIMKEKDAGEIGGVIHCFSYGPEMAKAYLDMGFYLGIGGVVTFQNAKKLKEVVAYMPIEQLVLETDCPYLSPVPNRGKRNTSLNLPFIIEEISKIKKMSVDEVIDITNINANKLYRIKNYL